MLTLMGSLRGLHLLVLLPRKRCLPPSAHSIFCPSELTHRFYPVIVRYCKPKSPVAVPSLDDEPDAPSKDAPAHPLHDSKFDLRILQCSIAIDALRYKGFPFIFPFLTVSQPDHSLLFPSLCSYTLILLSNNPVSFLLATAGTCFGGGAGPALSSLALALLPSAKHSGRLFGGLAVLQACLSTVAGRKSDIFPLLTFGLPNSPC
jgi:hypothetical protein